MGDGHYSAGEIVQKLLQPGHAFCIEVVGGLIQQNHIRVGQQQAAKCHPAQLTARQGANIRIPRRQAQGVCGHFQLMVQVVSIRGLDNIFQPRLLLGQRIKVGIRLRVVRVHLVQPGQGVLGFLHPFLHITAHILIRIQLRFLWQVTDINTRLRPRLPQDVRINPRHNAQQGRFTRAVQAQHADLGAGKERQGDILQDGFLGRHDFANPVHGVDVLGHGVQLGCYSEAADFSRILVRGVCLVLAIAQPLGSSSCGIRPANEDNCKTGAEQV